MKSSRTARSLLRLIFFISLLTLLGSLYYGYFGEPIQNLMSGDLFNTSNGLPACDICRYVRICMFPLVFISGVGLLKKDLGSIDYMLPLLVIGLLFSAYKYWLQKFAVTQETGFCVRGVPCSDIAVEYFGFATIPFLSGVVCLILLGLIWWIHTIRSKK